MLATGPYPAAGMGPTKIRAKQLLTMKCEASKSDCFEDVFALPEEQPKANEIENCVHRVLSQPGSSKFSTKEVRNKLQDCFLADLSGRKKEINAIILRVAEGETTHDPHTHTHTHSP